MSNDKTFHSTFLAASLARCWRSGMAQRRALCLVALALLVPGCAAATSQGAGTGQGDGDDNEVATPVGVERSQAQPEAPPPIEVRESGRAVLHTSEGPIAITFFPEVAPKTVAHISALMTAGCYSGIEFFRLEPGFVTQVSPVPDNGCHPDTASTVPAEFAASAETGVKHERLMLSLARWDEPDSGTSSWSIMLGAYPAMDGQYAIFGRVVEGEDAIKKIEAIGATMGENGMKKPKRAVTIERVEMVQPVEEPAAAAPESPDGGAEGGGAS